MPILRKIHKWASLLVGLQLLIWLLSGIFFNMMDHDKAKGHTYKSHQHTDTVIANSVWHEPQRVLARFKPSVELKQISLLGQPYYLLTHDKGLYRHFVNDYTLIDGITGEAANIDQAFANRLANNSYGGPGTIVSTLKLMPPAEDFPRHKNPVWQVRFDDDIDTSVYIDASSGQVVGHSDEDKRFADFFFMLHFMDYANEGSFNNVQIIIFAFITLWLSITGLIWTYDLYVRGQYKVKWFAKQRGVKLFDRNNKSLGSVVLSTHTNLLDALADKNIALPSTCGGGGTCGRCRLMINPNVKATSADELHFNQQELQQGFRLACQHFCDDIEQMTLIDVTDAKKHRLELVTSRFVSPTMQELRFKALGNQRLTYKAGAFMRFFIPAAQGQSIPAALPDEFSSHWQHVAPREYAHQACTRSYSIAQSSNSSSSQNPSSQGSEELMFTIKVQAAASEQHMPGVGSNYLANLAPGDCIDALGPFEEFYVSDNNDKTLVLLGAGSGMAPLKSIIDEQLNQVKTNPDMPVNSMRPIHFFYGNRTEIDLIYAEEFYQLAQDNEHFHYYPTLSQPNETWLGATGYAQKILELNLDSLGPLEHLEFYLCGPQTLMTQTIELLKAKGVDESVIKFDSFA